MSSEPPVKKISAVPGLAIIGLFLTGLAGLVHAFYTDSPIGLLAAVLAFGVPLVVAFR